MLPPLFKGPILSCDVGNGFGKVSVLNDPSSDPIFLLPDALAVGMPSTAYVAPDGTIEVYGVKRKRANRAVRAAKQLFDRPHITLKEKGETYRVAPTAVYAAIVRDLVKLANQQRAIRGEAPIYQLLLTYPAVYKLQPAILGMLKESVESVELDGHRLQVCGMISEPGAVAVDFLHLSRSNQPREKFSALVYDLGYGTFDTAVVTAYADPAKPCDLICQDGLPDLGGQRFDEALLEELIAQLRYGLGENVKFNREVLRALAVEMKHELSDAPICERDIVLADGDAHVSISREEFEAMLLPMLHETLQTVLKLLEEAESLGVNVDAIVLSGGSSRIPLVRKLLLELTGGTIPVELYRPSMAVTFGAARVAWGLTQPRLGDPEPAPGKETPGQQTAGSGGSAVVRQYCERACGIRYDGSVHLLLGEEAALPAASRPLAFQSAGSGLTEFRLHSARERVGKAACAQVAQCREILRLHIPLPPNAPCSLTMRMDESRCIWLDIRLPDGNTLSYSTFDAHRKDV